MPHNRHFCHACQREFEAQDNSSLQCSHCGSDFVEKVTELTFTREERQQARTQQSQARDIHHDDDADDTTHDNEQTTEEMLFGSQGLFSTLIPIIIDVDATEEGESRTENHTNTNPTNLSNSDGTQGQTRRERFGHNLVHNIIPRVLQRILHRHEQHHNHEQQQQHQEEEEEEGIEREGGNNQTNQQGMNHTEQPAPLSSFDFTIPSGRRGRIAIFAGNP